MPAARKDATPSALASSSSRPAPSSPHTACTALARFVRSLACFHRMMSGRPSDTNVALFSAAAIISAVASRPDGYRPMSRMPVTGVE